jgi:hypothetical protein
VFLLLLLPADYLQQPCPSLLSVVPCADLGQCNALTNQEAKLVLKQFSMANQAHNKMWSAPPLAVKAMEYLDKLEPKTDVQHKETVGQFRE